MFYVASQGSENDAGVAGINAGILQVKDTRLSIV